MPSQADPGRWNRLQPSAIPPPCQIQLTATLPIRLFNELGVPRETVLKEWGLTEQTFIVQKAGPFI